MLLLVDAGNTRIKWALVELDAPAVKLGSWPHSGSVTHEQIGQLETAWRAFPIERVVVSNVAGPKVREDIERIVSHNTQSAVPIDWFASVAALAGVRNGYRTPQQLGCDRFASAIGAHACFPDQALVIVTCGTATTIDVVNADGLFVGGMILPGLNLMAQSLARNTAQLPQVLRQEANLPLFADNTEEAIAGGCAAAQVGAIERAFAACVRSKAPESVSCILSGGAAAVIIPHLAIPYIQVDNLILPGLQTAFSHYR